MKVIALSRPLARLIALLYLSVPLAALEVILATRASWWRLPLNALAVVSGVTLVWVITLSIGLARGRVWAFIATAVLAVAWCAGTFAAAGRLEMTSLGFLGVLLLAYWASLLLLLRSEFRKSYFNPGLHWFEGSPRPISFLSCDVIVPEAATPARFRVSRLDRDGTFLYSDGAEGQASMENVLSGNGGTRAARDLIFQFRDRQVRCRGVPMRYFRRRASGAGFRFQELSLDTRKGLGDFIETLRGEGYVE